MDDDQYCGWCGQDVSGGKHEDCSRRQLYDPPRYCTSCARRMTVQITPSGWSAKCRYHGVVSSPAGES